MIPAIAFPIALNDAFRDDEDRQGNFSREKERGKEGKETHAVMYLALCA